MTPARPELGGVVAAIIAAALSAAACGHAKEPVTVQPDKPRPTSVDAAVADPYRKGGLFKTGAGEAHVGYLIANVAGAMAAPAEYCLDDGSRYRGAPYRLGRINVFFAGSVPEAALNAPAIIFGQRRTGLDTKVTRIGTCPPVDPKAPVPQLRSDWVAEETDWQGRTTMARLAKADYIEAVAVYPVPLMAVRRNGDSVELTLTNPFDRPLGASATFALYYEGGPKKPMPRFDAQALDGLAPGAAKTFTVAAPPRAARPTKLGAGRNQFRGYLLKGTLGDVRLDLLVTVTQ